MKEQESGDAGRRPMRRHNTPWRVRGGLIGGHAIIDANDNEVIPRGVATKQALRVIVASVNACGEIPVDELEALATGDIARALDHVRGMGLLRGEG